MKIITGSLGNISKPLAEDLVKQGHHITVISSNTNKKSDIEALGAIAAIGSLEDIDFLTETFTGADAVYVMVPPNLNVPDPRAYYNTIGNNYAKAISQSGVKRVVHLSSMGGELDKGTGIILGSHDVEAILGQLQGISLTILRPAYFYTNLSGFIGMIKHMGFISTNYGGDTKIVMAHPKDIADAAAVEITTADVLNKVKYVVSGEYSANETAKILGTAIGKPDLQWLKANNEQMQQGLESSGFPASVAALFVEMGDSIESGIIRRDYDQHDPYTGKITLEEFATEFAVAFNS